MSEVLLQELERLRSENLKLKGLVDTQSEELSKTLVLRDINEDLLKQAQIKHSTNLKIVVDELRKLLPVVYTIRFVFDFCNYTKGVFSNTSIAQKYAKSGINDDGKKYDCKVEVKYSSDVSDRELYNIDTIDDYFYPY